VDKCQEPENCYFGRVAPHKLAFSPSSAFLKYQLKYQKAASGEVFAEAAFLKTPSAQPTLSAASSIQLVAPLHDALFSINTPHKYVKFCIAPPTSPPTEKTAPKGAVLKVAYSPSRQVFAASSAALQKMAPTRSTGRWRFYHNITR
jgi:hypothetical protein